MRIMDQRFTIECKMGKIAEQCDVDAIVNPANAQLSPGWGISGSIHAAAGSDLYQECLSAGLLSPGKTVTTNGYRLPCKRVIHCVVPMNKHACTPKKLRECFQNLLMAAEQEQMESIAIPALIPGGDVARLAYQTITELAPQLKFLKKVRFVLIRRETVEEYRAVFNMADEKDRKIS